MTEINQEDQVLINLRQIIRATDLYSRQLNKEVGLTAPQLLILQAIRGLGAVSISKLSQQVSLSQATVTNIIDRLESRGLVARHRSTEDRRVVHATLTEVGARKVFKNKHVLTTSFPKCTFESIRSGVVIRENPHFLLWEMLECFESLY